MSILRWWTSNDVASNLCQALGSGACCGHEDHTDSSADGGRGGDGGGGGRTPGGGVRRRSSRRTSSPSPPRSPLPPQRRSTPPTPMVEASEGEAPAPAAFAAVAPKKPIAASGRGVIENKLLKDVEWMNQVRACV